MATADPIEKTTDKTRVKVFELDPNSTWVDKGTGYVSCVYIEAKDGFCIVVQSEEDGTAVMNAKVRQDDIYQRQKDTLIVWSEPNGVDLALSFQESEGRDFIWDQLEDVRKRLAADKHDIDQLPLTTDDMFPDEEFMPLADIKLPEPEVANLNDIQHILIAASRSVDAREQVVRQMQDSGFLPKFLQLLEICEDMAMQEELFTLSNLMRAIIFLNDNSIYEFILRDENYPLVVGMLEYDREYPDLKANHREHFKKHSQPKMVIPIQNALMRTKINQTYRAQYLKDVALARLLDDTTFSSLNAITYFNYHDIISYIQQDQEFLDTIFSLFTKPDITLEQRKEATLFIQELTTIAKQLQKPNRTALYQAMGPSIFNVLQFTLTDESDPSIRIAGLAILSSVLDHDPSVIRNFCLTQNLKGESLFLDSLIDLLLKQGDTGLRLQVLEAIKTLLDTTGLGSADGPIGQPTQTAEVDDFLRFFYDNLAGKLFATILSLDATKLTPAADGSMVFISDTDATSMYQSLCEILCFAITHHAMFCKNYFALEPILKCLTVLLKSNHSFLRLSAVKVFRTCVDTNEEFYRRQMVRHEVFGPLLNVLVDTKGRNNLLNSACLVIFEKIRAAPAGWKQVITHIVTNYRKYLDALDYTEIFKGLVLKYEQGLESLDSEANALSQSTDTALVSSKDGWSRLDHTEEAYFNDSDDEIAEKNAAVAASDAGVKKDVLPPPPMSKKASIDKPLEFVKASKPLVDYPVDDDDNEDEELDEIIGVKRRSVSKSPTPKFQFSISRAFSFGKTCLPGTGAANADDAEAEKEKENLTSSDASGTDLPGETSTGAVATSAVLPEGSGKDTQGVGSPQQHRLKKPRVS